MTKQTEMHPVLLLSGETGTGKQVAARYFHQLGNWHLNPFVQVDCTALSEELIEAELFGCEANALAHIKQTTAGLIEAAESGTLFLDEISELSLSVQAKILNVLERRTIRRLGSTVEIPVQAHFVVSTNRHLPEMVAQGRFRSDLYYRLNVLEQHLPPLRDRTQDIAELAQFFIEQYARRYGLEQPRLDFEVMREMQNYHWPGNIRELQHVLERAVMLSKNGLITTADLPIVVASAEKEIDTAIVLEDMTVEQVEKFLLEKALQKTSGNVSKSARELGLTRMAMRYRMEKYGL